MRSRNTLGEALLAMISLLGFIFLANSGHLQTAADQWLYVSALCTVAGFYAVLLLIRALFSFMAGGDSFWWEKYEGQNPHHHKKK